MKTVKKIRETEAEAETGWGWGGGEVAGERERERESDEACAVITIMSYSVHRYTQYSHISQLHQLSVL